MQQESKPIVKIPFTQNDLWLEVAALVAILLGLLVVLMNVHNLPQTIPTHFCMDGKPDNWGSKNTLFMFPAMNFGMYILLSAITLLVTRYPQIGNYPVAITEENAERQYHNVVSLMRWMKLEFAILISYLTWSMIQTIQGKGQLSFVFIPLAIVAVFGTVIVFIAKAIREK